MAASLKHLFNASISTKVVTCFHLELTSTLVGVRERRVSEVPACHSKSHVLVTYQGPSFSTFLTVLNLGFAH